MATYSGGVLSGSTDGRPIKITATSLGGAVTVHTAAANTGEKFDAVTLYVNNTTAATATLNLAWGGTPTDPDDLICKDLSIPPNSGPIPLTSGLRLNNSQVIRAWSGTANALNLTGGYDRVS